MLETALAPEALPMRACDCGFCRRHGVRATSDPAGHLEITVRDPAQLIRYRFGLRTADFLICARCGIYVAAVLEEGGRSWATVNANTFDDVDRLRPEAESVSYGGESEAERRARRRARWTPAAVLMEA